MKKNLFIIFLLFSPVFVFAQTFKQIADSLFFHLDKSGVTTGILYDRIYPLAGLHQFNKTQADTASNKHFRQVYSELFNAAYSNTSWLPPEYISAISSQLITDSAGVKVPIGLLNYQFNLIDTNAIDNNLIQMGIDSLYYDVIPRSTSPFLQLDGIIASPLIDSIQGLTVSYFLDSRLFFNKSSLSISSIQVDFNDGNGLVSVTVGNAYTINYSAAGYKALRFVVTLSNSTIITTYAAILITQPQLEECSRSSCNLISPKINIESSLSFQGYDESSTSKGRGEYKIFYATNGNCDGVLRKPIVVVDGFDPGDNRSIDQLYYGYLNKENFAENLRADGYDVIVLNFPRYQIGSTSFLGLFQIPVMRDGGADYIERNARVLMTLINTVNSQKQGNEKLVIIGPSMGGLISRYALSYMEQNSMLHHTRLWVSFDSPHQGANIPIGDQRWLDFYGKRTGSEEIIANRDGKIGSVAAKQMLIKHYLSSSGGGAPTFRSQFLSNINALGFPVGDPNEPFRKISLIDGNLGGVEINSPGQKGFTFDVRRLHSINLLLFKIRYKTYTVASARMYFTPSYGGQNAVFDGWYLNKAEEYIVSTPSNTSGVDVAPGGLFDTQAQISGSGDGQIQRVLDLFNNGGGLRFEAKFYSVVPNHSFINTKSALAFSGSNQNLSENLSNRSLVCTGETPFDSYFGDFEINRDHVDLWDDAITYVKNEIDGIPQLPLIKNTTLAITGPVQSGTSTTYSISNLPSGASVKWEVSSPYTISGSNTAVPVGVVIPSNNTQFAELVATVSTNCYQTKVKRTLVPPVITTILSSGSDPCGSGSATINVPSGINFTWTATGDVSIEGQGQHFETTSNTVSVVGLAGTLTVSFKSYGNTVSTYKDYSPYNRELTVTGYQPLSPGDPLTVTAQNIDFGVETFNWYINDVLVESGTSEMFMGDSSWEKYNRVCGNNSVKLEAVLSCGTTLLIGETGFEQLCYGWRSALAIYPNPASQYITVDLDKNKQKTLSKSEKAAIKEYEVSIFDIRGRLMLKGKSKDYNINLDTRNLKSDRYFLHIRSDGEKEVIKKQIIIKNE